MHFFLPKENIHGHIVLWQLGGAEFQNGFIAFDLVNPLLGDAIELSIDLTKSANFIELFLFEMLDEVSCGNIEHIQPNIVGGYGECVLVQVQIPALLCSNLCFDFFQWGLLLGGIIQSSVCCN